MGCGGIWGVSRRSVSLATRPYVRRTGHVWRVEMWGVLKEGVWGVRLGGVWVTNVCGG